MNNAKVNESFVFANYITSCHVYSLFEPLNEIPTKFVNQKCSLHVLPGNLVVFWSYWHILVKTDHVRTGIVVGPTKQEGQKQHHC